MRTIWGGRLCRVGVVAVGHQVAVRVNLAEHAADHIPFALAVFPPHNGPGLGGQLCRAVGGIVVVHIDVRLGQGGPVILHHLRHRLFLVVAGNEHCYLSHVEPSFSPASPSLGSSIGKTAARPSAAAREAAAEGVSHSVSPCRGLSLSSMPQKEKIPPEPRRDCHFQYWREWSGRHGPCHIFIIPIPEEKVKGWFPVRGIVLFFAEKAAKIKI